MKSFVYVFPVLTAAMLTGCAATSNEAVDDLVSKPAADITVLSASSSRGPIGTMQRSECSPLPGGEFDCTKAYERRFGLPLMHDVILSTPEEARCNTLVVRTASRSDAFDQASSTGIGFFYAGYTGQGRFVPKSELKEVDSITLRTGGRATVHEFAAFANCFLGTASSSSLATYKFRPYLQFEANGEVYRNWDNVSSDYVIRVGVPSFDRFNELALPTQR